MFSPAGEPRRKRLGLAFRSAANVDHSDSMNLQVPRDIDRIRRDASNRLDPEKRSEFGQYMTPSAIAGFMASLVSNWPEGAHVLDPGAGIGSLSEAVAACFLGQSHGSRTLKITAFEIEPLLVEYLKDTFTVLEQQSARSHVSFVSTIHQRDFIDDACLAVNFGVQPYTHSILNPPYLKIRSDSGQRRCLRQVGLEVVNLYAAFLGLAIALTMDGGEIVAIVPRSFCNGTYFLPFRKWMLEKVSIKQLHVFDSRNSAFSDDEVLQENVIIHLERAGQQDDVVISTCRDSTFTDLIMRRVPFSEVVYPNDDGQFIHIPTNDVVGLLDKFSLTLDELGLQVSTGPIVDFRAKQFLRAEPTAESAVLLYPHHFSGGSLIWPKPHRKPNAICVNDTTQKSLMPKGWYVVTRRFSAKEEARRIVAHVVNPNTLNREWIGFENHLNVFHTRKHGIDSDVAFGLAAFLNSAAIDNYFRNFSGHTQVNATDLRSIRYPSIDELTRFGKWARSRHHAEQISLDSYLADHAEN